MKLTKHAQSCFLIETEGKKILIDPGMYCYDEKIENLKPEDWKNIDIMLLTHRHSDHAHADSIKIIQENNPDVKIYCNSETKKIMDDKGVKCNLVKVGDKVKEGNVEIDVVKAIHGFLYLMRDKGLPKENNGFVIKAEGKTVYHTGDTIAFWTEIRPDVVLIPVCGHGVVLEPLNATEWAIMLEAKLVIPMHYDGPKHPLGTDKFEEEIKKTDLKYKILKNGETIEV